MTRESIESAIVWASEKCLYLDLQLIQPGDVLLTAGGGKDSALIRGATWGPFSHAALVMGGATLFESEDAGVGYTHCNIHRMEKEPPRILSRLKKTVQGGLVLRHQYLDGASVERLKEFELKLTDLANRHWGKEYPQWVRLAPAVRGGSLFRGLAAAVLGLRDRVQKTKVTNPGPFCSQLVAEVLSTALGEQLFTPPKAPETVNPNEFLDSALAPVPHAVCHANLKSPLDRGWSSLGVPKHKLEGRAATAAVVRLKAAAQKLGEDMTVLASTMSDMRIEVDPVSRTPNGASMLPESEPWELDERNTPTTSNVTPCA